MWLKKYRDYPPDHPLIKEQVEPGHGIIGCEMHDLNGWGLSHHRAPKKSSLWRRLITYLFQSKQDV